jgi:hypothetical protein
MLPDTGIDDVKKQRNAEYAKRINDPVLPSLKMEGIRLLFLLVVIFILEHTELLVPMVAQSKACSQSSAEIVGLNPTRDMDVCLF